MRLIDRLYEYLKLKKITPYTFERRCGMSNGYLKKQSRGKGTIGSDMLERIYHQYLDLSLIWLITGEGEMLLPEREEKGKYPGLNEEERAYLNATDEMLQLLRDQVQVLSASNADKEKIIRLLESRDSREGK